MTKGKQIKNNKTLCKTQGVFFCMLVRSKDAEQRPLEAPTGNAAVDTFFKGNIELINNFMMALAEEQIKAAFDQSEKEVTDLHSRISQGMREAKKNGVKIGLPQGTTLTTKKALECMAIIKKHSKDFGGSLEDPDVIKLCGCSRNSYYKYKKEAKSN